MYAEQAAFLLNKKGRFFMSPIYLSKPPYFGALHQSTRSPCCFNQITSVGVSKTNTYERTLRLTY